MADYRSDGEHEDHWILGRNTFPRRHGALFALDFRIARIPCRVYRLSIPSTNQDLHARKNSQTEIEDSDGAPTHCIHESRTAVRPIACGCIAGCAGNAGGSVRTALSLSYRHPRCRQAGPCMRDCCKASVSVSADPIEPLRHADWIGNAPGHAVCPECQLAALFRIMVCAAKGHNFIVRWPTPCRSLEHGSGLVEPEVSGIARGSTPAR